MAYTRAVTRKGSSSFFVSGFNNISEIHICNFFGDSVKGLSLQTMRNVIVILLLVMASAVASQAQTRNDLVQFSGVVVTADSLQPVPFAHIAVGKTGRGTTADYYGFFSIVVHKNDLITFRLWVTKPGFFIFRTRFRKTATRSFR